MATRSQGPEAAQTGRARGDEDAMTNSPQAAGCLDARQRKRGSRSAT